MNKGLVFDQGPVEWDAGPPRFIFRIGVEQKSAHVVLAQTLKTHGVFDAESFNDFKSLLHKRVTVKRGFIAVKLQNADPKLSGDGFDFLFRLVKKHPNEIREVRDLTQNRLSRLDGDLSFTRSKYKSDIVGAGLDGPLDVFGVGIAANLDAGHSVSPADKCFSFPNKPSMVETIFLDFIRMVPIRNELTPRLL